MLKRNNSFTRRLLFAFFAIAIFTQLPEASAQTPTITVTGSAIFCNGDSVLLTASAGDTYQWKNFGSNIPGATSQTYYAKQTGQYTVVVTTGGVPQTSAVTNITVNPLPTLFINSSASSICSGIPVSLSLNGNNNAGNAASFNSSPTNDHVFIPHQSQLTSSVITVEAWVRPQQANTAATIISKLPPATSSEIGYAFRQTTNNKLQFVIGNEGSVVTAESNTVSIGPWYHLTGTYDGSTVKLYINGSSAGPSSSASTNVTINSTYPIIVANQHSMNAPYKGLIDELRIWNHAKPSSEIQCNYKTSAAPTASNLVGYWKMNEAGSGTTPDATSYQNNGVVGNNTSLASSTAGVNNLYAWQPVPGITNVSSPCITIFPATTTTYTATATNYLGCSVTNSVTITVFPTGQKFNVTGGGIFCSGGPGVPIGLSGSEIGAQYQLKKGALNIGSLVAGTGGPLIVGTVTDAGTYTVIAVNPNCTSTMNGSVTVVVHNSPQITAATVTNAICNGSSTGAVDVSVSGGTTPYFYNWSNNAISQDINNVLAGDYGFTVTDANGCTDKDTFTVGQPTAPLASAVVANVTCNGFNNGGINIATGGTPPYTFNWSNNATTQNISNLSPGNYSVIVTDGIGCISSSTFTVTQPAVLTVPGVVTNVSCNNGNDGSINITATGGTAPYTYLWNNNNNINNEDPVNLSVGTYTVIVTDANSCIASQNFTVIQPALLTGSAVATNASCFNGNNGIINLTPAGGTAPYAYLWSNNSTAEDPTGLSAGNYSVTITDSKGCTANTSATVGQPTQISISGTTTNVSCFAASTGTITISVSGGTPGYTYSWSTGATTQNVTNVPAGTHTVTVTDANGCTATASFTISQPSPFVISKVLAMPTCHGDNDGAIDITASGGTGPFTYNWSNNATTEDINSLLAGDYTVTVSYGNNSCTYTETITLSEPGLLTPVASPIHVSCLGNNQDGGVDLSVTGGTAPYAYLWNTGATTQDLGNLTFGTYSVTVTDAHGCSSGTSASVAQPAPVAITGVVNNVSCYGIGNGSINVTPTSGMAPFSYQWSNNSTAEDPTNLSPGTYSVVVTDFRSCTTSASFTVTQPASALTSSILGTTNILCHGNSTGSIDLTVAGGTTPYTYNWNNNATTQDLSGVPAGNYNVTVTDNNGCTSTQSVTLTQPAAALSVAKTVTQVSCNGGANGSIDISVSGGTTPYSYNWSNNSTVQDLNGLIAGNYSVTITDANGCSDNNSTAITEPVLLTISGTATNVACNGQNNGSVNITVSGGTAPYSYNWSNNAATEDISGLAPGNYSVTVTDAKGCTASQNYSITQPGVLAATATPVNISCFGTANGAINLSVSGGNTPYSFIWSNNATTQNISGLSTGIYNALITDAKGCITTATATITQPATAVSVTGVTSNVTTFNGNDGAIDITVAGGVPPYSYSWSNNLTSEDQFGLIAGTYTVVVTDANGCTKSVSFTITQPAPPNPMVASISVSPVYTVNPGGLPYTIYLGYGTQSVTLTVTVSGGMPGYTYSWSPQTGVASPSTASTVVSPQATTTYNVTITDALGATHTVSQTINVIDVRCGNNNNKILLCHNGNDLCISPAAVATHIAHGDLLGPCPQAKSNNTENDEVYNEEEGLADLVIENIKVYPNPSNGVFMVEVPAGTENAEVAIFDMTGKQIDRKAATDTRLQFDLGSAAKGVYMIHVISGHKTLRTRISLQ